MRVVKAEVDHKISGIFKAIEDGLYEPSMKDCLAELKAQKEAIELETLPPAPMAMDILQHPRSTLIYGRWVERLDQSLKGDNPYEATELVRSLIDHIDLTPRPDGPGLDATL